MESDDYNFMSSQQSQDNDDTLSKSKKKKKKSKKSKRNSEGDFNETGTHTDNEQLSQITLPEEDETFETPIPSKKKSSKRKHTREALSPTFLERSNDEDVENDRWEEQNQSIRKGREESTKVPSTSKSRFSTPKKEAVTPSKKVPTSDQGVVASEQSVATSSVNDLKINLSDGINIIASMSHDDIELLLSKVEAECPLHDTKRPAQREAAVDWNKIAFSCYGPQQCRSAWAFLMNQTRKYRIMNELVQEVKYNLKADYNKFMRKNIESAPDFPKQPYASGGFQYFCKEKWDEHKNLQEKMNKKVENFLHFQTKCHEKWANIGEEKQKVYDQKAKLLVADYRLKVQEYYRRYPAFARSAEKLNKDGKPESKDKPMSDYYRKQVLKMSQEMFKDAPRLPLAPMHLYVQHKMKRVTPTPEPADEPELKSHFVNKWKELDGEKRLKWIQKCIKYWERYQIEITEYKKTHPMFVLPREFQISKLINKEEFQIWTENHGLPPKPKNSVFEFFLQEFQSGEDVSDLSEEQLLQTAKEKWNSMSNLEKERCKLNYRMYHLNFRTKLETYIGTVPEILRPCIIDILPKKYKKQFLEEVDKEPLVKEDDLLEIQDEGASASGLEASQKRKRPGAEDDSDHQDESSAKGSKTKKKRTVTDNVEDPTIPLYAQELSNEHKRLIDEQIRENREAHCQTDKDERRKSKGKHLEEQNTSSYYPGKNISPRLINDAIHGIFDGRQSERRFTVYYYYAKYVARETSWLQLYRTIGIVETAARIIETFNRLSKQQQQVFLDEAYRFHCDLRFFEKPGCSKDNVFMSNVRLFPEEPKAPPRKAAVLYQADMKMKKLRNPNDQAPPWEEVDDKTKMFYLKKVYRINREYILEYERFVRNMTPNDMIEYLIRKSLEWDAGKLKEVNYLDRCVYSTADATQTQLARKTYALEMSCSDEVAEPEVFSGEDGSVLSNELLLATHKFKYTTNPFSHDKAHAATLVERLSSTANTVGKDDVSDIPSSTSDEDEEEYGHLVRTDKEKKRDIEFRREFRKLTRYYYVPATDDYEIVGSSCSCLKQATRSSKCYIEKIQGTEIEMEQDDKWAHIRSIINSSQRNSETGVYRRPALILDRNQRKRKVAKIARTKRGRKILPRKSKSLRSIQMQDDMNALSLPGSTLAHQHSTVNNNMSAQDTQSSVAHTSQIVSKSPNSSSYATANEQGFEERENEDADEVPSRFPTLTTKFIQTAAVSGTERRRNFEVGDEEFVNPRSQQPGFMLVPHSPDFKRTERKEKHGSPKLANAYSGLLPCLSERVELQSDASWSHLTTTMTPIISLNDSEDEFRIIDSLADGGTGIFSESELAQLGELT